MDIWNLKKFYVNCDDLPTKSSISKPESGSSPVKSSNSSSKRSSCRISNVDPWDEAVRPFVFPDSPRNCSIKPPLTKVEGNDLIFIPHLAYLHSSNLPLQCCYRNVKRPHDLQMNIRIDALYYTSGCKVLSDRVTLTPEEDFIIVKCLDNRKLEVYKDFHIVFSIKEKILPETNQIKNRPNVLMIGSDSVSRLNLYRTMPKVVEYMKNEGWLEMKSYNKVDDNTLPNFSALLSGLTLQTLERSEGCKKDRLYPFDNCSFIWRDFSREGYITAYGEESARISTFNNYNFGFSDPPTDYYLRPFFLAAEDKRKFDRGDIHICLGSQLAVDHVLGFSKDF